ncbi:MAG: hypothetical protein IPN46_18755 [Saprospiraceae bacterium]|nr:hypothetical protein [Saprospiraceae bacterium]
MTFDQIIKEIKGGKYSPVYFLHGEEPFYIDKICEYIEKNDNQRTGQVVSQSCAGKSISVDDI